MEYLDAKLWDVANTALAICVAQTMTFIYKCTDSDIRDQLRENQKTYLFTLLIIIVGGALYCLVAWGCQAGHDILHEINKQYEKENLIWFVATAVRLFVIFALTALSLLAVSIMKKAKKNN